MRRSLFPLLALVAALCAIAPAGAGAATINVDTTADEYNANPTCSLREAVQASNTEAAFGGCPAGVDNDQIVLPAGTYTVGGAAGDDANVSGDLDARDASQPGDRRDRRRHRPQQPAPTASSTTLRAAATSRSAT